MLRALVQLLEEAESLRESYSNARQFDGWDSIEEEPCFALARAAIAKATTLTHNADVTGAATALNENPRRLTAAG